MTSSNADDFYERVLSGTGYSKEIVLTHKSGDELEGVEMSPVPKRDVADAIQHLPDEVMEQAEEGSVDSQEAREIAEQQGSTSQVDGELVEMFEDVISTSLSHPDLSDSQMDQIVAELSLEGTFDLGAKVLNFSAERSGDVEGFREPN